MCCEISALEVFCKNVANLLPFMVAIIRKSWRKKLFDGVHKFPFLHLFAEVLDFLCPFIIIVPMTINVKIMMILGYTIINSYITFQQQICCHKYLIYIGFHLFDLNMYGLESF